MISLKKCREILAQDGKDLTDEQILELKKIFESCAMIELEHYIKPKQND